MSANDRPTLYNLADKQDRFEHEYSSDLVTRIGLFLVFAGFVSGVAIEVFKLIVEDPLSLPRTGRYLSEATLAISVCSLFTAMVVLLWASLLPGYSVPGKISDYRTKYRELVKYYKEERKADTELGEWILDATAEAVDRNIERNGRRATAIWRASRFLLVSIISLFVCLTLFAALRLRSPSGSQDSKVRCVTRDQALERVQNAKKDDGKEATKGSKEANPAPK